MIIEHCENIYLSENEKKALILTQRVLGNLASHLENPEHREITATAFTALQNFRRITEEETYDA